MSIRSKLFLGITLLVVLFVSAAWLLNTRYLGSYYISEKKASLIQTGRTINGNYRGNPNFIYSLLGRLERTDGLAIVIVNKKYQVKYDSTLVVSFAESVRDSQVGPALPGVPTASGVLIQASMSKGLTVSTHLTEVGTQTNVGATHVRGKVSGETLALANPQSSLLRTNLSAILQGHAVFSVTQDPFLRENVLNLAMHLNNGDFLLMDIPLAAIQDSVAIANRFFLFTGLCTILIGSVAAFLFARRFTKPILTLSDIARRMSELDFTMKYPVSRSDEIGELGRSINFLSDQLDKSISQLQTSNEQLQKDIDRERKMEEMRKEFVSSVSHELKTPIALIQGYAEGLQANVVEDEENKDYYCGVIMDEAGRMDRLVKDLLSLSQLESGYFHLERSVFDISALIDRVLAKFRPIIQAQSAIVQTEKDEEVDAYGDDARIEQVFVNYLNNAIYHLDERKIVKVTVSKVGRKVRVSVFNSGEVIPEESLCDIWNSFYKVDRARTRVQEGGSGLGLSIVRAIQELHGNDYGVMNLDQGVLFWFDVDCA